VHFVLDALDTRLALVNQRGPTLCSIRPRCFWPACFTVTRPTCFPPADRAFTYENVATGLLCAASYADHDTLCVFHCKNAALLTHAFAQKPEVAVSCGVRKVDALTVAIDGTKMLVNASKPAAVISHSHAEQADAPRQDGVTLFAELQRRQQRKAEPADYAEKFVTVTQAPNDKQPLP
jgi:hypothetical protein